MSLQFNNKIIFIKLKGETSLQTTFESELFYKPFLNNPLATTKAQILSHQSLSEQMNK